MSSEVTQLETNRRLFMKRGLWGFGLWQLPHLASYVHWDGVKWMGVLTTGLSLLGVCIWGFYLVKLMLLSRYMQKKLSLAIPLNNEYFRWIRLKSFTFGFWGIVGSASLLFTLSLYMTIEVRLALHLLLVIAVVFPQAVYLYFDKDERLQDE